MARPIWKERLSLGSRPSPFEGEVGHFGLERAAGRILLGCRRKDRPALHAVEVDVNARVLRPLPEARWTPEFTYRSRLQGAPSFEGLWGRLAWKADGGLALMQADGGARMLVEGAP
jgi:hypothetical protein